MIKLCYITTVSVTIKAFILDAAKYLHEHGNFDISIICDYDDQLEAMLPEHIHYYPVKMVRGVSLGGVKATLEIKKIMAREKFDIVQYSTPNASLYAALASWMTRTPVRLYCQWGMVYVGFSGLKRKIFKYVEKLVCRLSTWIEPDSFGNLKFSHEEGLYPESKGSVIWNGSSCGVDFNKFTISNKQEWKHEIRTQYGISDDAVVYIFVGRITRDKGINELLSAAKNIIRIKENAYLLLVGNTESTQMIDQELYAWSLKENRVIYCGFTNAVEKYLAASDVYVLPSYREGFGSAAVEAEAMGVPIIITDIPGLTDAVQEGVTGLVVGKASAQDLERAMLVLYDNYSLRENLGMHAYAFAKERFDQQKLFSKILEDRLDLLKKAGK